MSDLLFCFSELDIERVKPIERALAEREYQIATYNFKDYSSIETQKLRAKVQKARAVVLFWSLKTTLTFEIYKSLNTLIHPAKIVSVMLDNLRPAQIPAPLTIDDFIRLRIDKLNDQNAEWLSLLEKVADRVNPAWMSDEVKAKVQEIEFLQTKHDAAVGDRTRFEKLLSAEVEAHNESRDKQAALLAECGQLKKEVDQLNQFLVKARKNSQALESQLGEMVVKKHSHTALSGAIILSLLAGAGGLYLAAYRPLESKFVAGEKTIEDMSAQAVVREGQIKALNTKVADEALRYKALQGKFDQEQLRRVEVSAAFVAYKDRTSKELEDLQKSKAHFQQLVEEFEASERLRKEGEEQSAAALEKLEAAEGELTSLRSALEQAEARLAVSDREISDAREEALRSINEIKERAAKDIGELSRKVRELEARLKAKKK